MTDHAEVVALYREGQTMEEVGRALGISRQRVHQILRFRGEPSRPRVIPSTWPSRDRVELFWSRVDRSGACWLWTRGRIKAGYGTFRVNGRQTYAHRIAYELLVGPIPDGRDVLHRCDTPPCVNPEHLWLGTDLDNMRDRAAKGRNRGGPNAPGRQGLAFA